MKDEAEQSNPSAGSVAARSAWGNAPVAWAAVAKNGLPLWLAYNRSDAEGAVVGMADVVPLYRAPTLTDAEREALSWARNAMLVGVAVLPDDQTHNSKQHAATLGALLGRTE